MIEGSSRVPARPSHWLRLLLRAGLLCGVVDLSWAIVLTLAYGSSLLGLFQTVAATAFGDAMFDGGWTAGLLGLATHFVVAFWWSAVFLILVVASPGLRRVLAVPAGVVGVAALYGPLIWITMSRLVIPALSNRAVGLDLRWWIQLVGHALFVGLPIVWAVATPLRRRSLGAST